MPTRRDLLKTTAALAGTALFGCTRSERPEVPIPVVTAPAARNRAARFKVGACDWSINAHSDVAAMETASRLGLDGVQLSLGRVENDMHLRRPDVQQAYKDAAAEYGVQIGGLAIGELNQVPYKSDPRTIAWVSDSIDVAQALGVGVILLAFFGDGDLKGDEAGQQEVIRRLKDVAPKAEEAGVIFGIESWLSADEHLAIIDAVGSPNVQVYYDVANSHTMGYDIYEEIRRLGSDLICEFHAKENGYLLGQGEIDFHEVRAAIDDIGFSGWLQIEGAVPEGADMFESYVANLALMRSVFPPQG